MSEPTVKGYFTAKEARKVLAKAKRDGKRPYIYTGLKLYTSNATTDNPLTYYDTADTIRVSWPIAEKWLKDAYETAERYEAKGKGGYMNISVHESIVFIG